MLPHPCWIFNYFTEGFSSSLLLLLCCEDEILKLRSVARSGPIQSEVRACAASRMRTCLHGPAVLRLLFSGSRLVFLHRLSSPNFQRGCRLEAGEGERIILPGNATDPTPFCPTTKTTPQTLHVPVRKNTISHTYMALCVMYYDYGPLMSY